jgi:hypothetical protein
MSKTTNSPSHRVYAVTKNGKQSYWQAIGAIWPRGPSDDDNLSVHDATSIRASICSTEVRTAKRPRRTIILGATKFESDVPG